MFDKKVSYEVLTHTICDGWVNIWTITGDSPTGNPMPMEFESIEDAWVEIKDALSHGDDPDQYMIIKITREAV
jgi:hypothetical protein